MQLDFLDALLKPNTGILSISETGVMIGQSKLPLVCVRNKRAKRYIIRLLPERVLRVTIPRGGSRREALRFVSKNFAWVEKQFLSLRLQDSLLPDEASLAVGTVLFRGRRVPVQRVCEDESLACFAGQCDRNLSGDSSLRDTVETMLYRLAKVELPEATGRLAKVHGFNPGRVTIRNQRTRWGSCSGTGAISLNWRLIQVPAFVRDYVILHELIHLDHLNHSIRFWERLAKACPNLNAAEAWLKLHGNRIC